WWTYVVVLAAGILLPPLMALIPLVKTSRTTVRAAIDHRGHGSTASQATGILAWLSGIHRLPRGLLLALRNTVRRPARFFLAVGLLASAGMVFVAGMSLSASVEAIGEVAKEQRNWDVDVQLASPTATDRVTNMVEQMPDVSRVEGWAFSQTTIAGPGQIPISRTYPDQGHGKVSVTAVPADTTMLTPPTLLEGRWLNQGETAAIVLNQVVRSISLPKVTSGDTVELTVGGEPTTWNVVGIARERQANGGVYVTSNGLAEATGLPERVNQLRIATISHDEQTRQAVAGDVDKILTEAGFGVQSAASVSRSEAISEGHLGPIIIIVLGIAIAMAVVGGTGLASTMSANILERTREFGVMHAIGARPKTVRRIVMGEGVFLAIVSCVVAVIPALALTAVLGAGLGNLFMNAPLPYRISLLAGGIWVALVVLGAILATEAAATRASRITVREALAYL
ncbi:MAG: FtsX-like permease family protein, partial [Acidimicrobiia bacterium]|nr:FtsX-like permease family protein [Acidimicrobiia bacterium]